MFSIILIAISTLTLAIFAASYYHGPRHYIYDILCVVASLLMGFLFGYALALYNKDPQFTGSTNVILIHFSILIIALLVLVTGTCYLIIEQSYLAWYFIGSSLILAGVEMLVLLVYIIYTKT